MDIEIKFKRAHNLELSRHNRCYKITAKYDGRCIYYGTMSKELHGEWWCSDIPHTHSFRDLKQKIRNYVHTVSIKNIC